MKSTIFTILLGLTVPLIAQTETVRLKAEIKTGQPGYTGIAPIASFRNLSDSNPWKKTEYEITGIPEGWTEWYRESIWFQTYQWTYQNYKMGNMSAERFGSLMDSWGFDTVAGQYSTKPIASATSMIYRKTSDGRVEYMVDTDVDHDFGDEKIYEVAPDLQYRQIDSAIAYAPWISYELFYNGVVVRDSLPLIVEKGSYENIGDYITSSPLIYAQSTTETDTLVITAARPDFTNSSISRLRKIDPKAEVNTGERIEEGKRIKLKDGWYTYNGFDRAKKEIKVTRVDTAIDTIYPSIGFYAPGFELVEVETGRELKLEDYSGKYVLLDFWGTWCKGCVLALPDIVEMNDDLSDYPFEIISVACFSNKGHFEELRAKYGMKWTHTWQVMKEGIVSDYAVESYPSMFLINPKGKIVGYNLSTAQVKAMVKAQK